MPRSFLVKTHSSHKVPKYRRLETQRGLPSEHLKPEEMESLFSREFESQDQ